MTIDNWAMLFDQMRICNKCSGRIDTREINSPFYPLGNINADVIFIGEAPGYQTRQKNGITFCGNRSGDYFLKICSKHGIHAGNSLFTNVVKCQAQYNRTPSIDEFLECGKYLDNEIELCKPLIIVAVGNSAIRHFDNKGTVSNYKGQLIKMPRYNCYFTAIYHPAYILRSELQRQYEVDIQWLKTNLDILLKEAK